MIPRLACALIVLAWAAPAEAWRLEAVAGRGAVRELIEIGGVPHVATAEGWFRVTGHGLRLEPARAPRFPPLPEGALPDGRIATGKTIARAWLAEPTDRYGHAVLGDAIEAASVVVERAGGRRDAVRLGPESVFEDLEPRIADLGEGCEKVLVVRSYAAAGAALAVIGERDGRFAILTETPPIGRPNRWLNPAGIADFDGDGAIEIALVKMPHVVGRLELWRWKGGALAKIAETRDVSNHAIGSRALRLSAVADFDGDGIVDLAVPSFDRRAIRLLSFRGGSVREIARVPVPAAVTTKFVQLRDAAGAPGVLFGAEGALFRLVR